jgi:hypothetical protein
MPIAQAPLEWKTEDVEIKEWLEVDDHAASWREPRIEASDDFGVVSQLDIYGGLQAEIENAQRILELEDDWDGEGSIRYSKETLNRAVAFLTTHMKGLWDSYGVLAPNPRIGPGPDGSIDLHWKEPSWELLVNIPADPHEMAVFYGDNYGVQKIRGSLDPNKVNLGIAAWLMD